MKVYSKKGVGQKVDKVQSFKVKRREGHQIVNVHEYWFKEGVERRVDVM